MATRPPVTPNLNPMKGQIMKRPLLIAMMTASLIGGASSAMAQYATSPDTAPPASSTVMDTPERWRALLSLRCQSFHIRATKCTTTRSVGLHARPDPCWSNPLASTNSTHDLPSRIRPARSSRDPRSMRACMAPITAADRLASSARLRKAAGRQRLPPRPLGLSGCFCQAHSYTLIRSGYK